MSNIKLQKIDSSDLDFNKIYTNSSDAYNNTNNVKVNENTWEEMDLSIENLDNGTQRIYNGDVAIGFTKIENPVNGTVATRMESSQNTNNSNESIETTKNVEEVSLNNVENGNSSNINYSEGSISTRRGEMLNQSEFNYRYDESNKIAQMAKEMGMTQEQIDIAVGISRWETGNYKHLAYGYNYGGVTGNGDLGSEGGYAKYSSPEVGMHGFLDNLQRNYFDQGLNTTESIARKYLGYADTAGWIKGVNGCKK